MTRSNTIINNFVGGEISPKLYGAFDRPMYSKSLEVCQNFIIETQGGARFRNGNILVHTTKKNNTGVLIPFQFNDQQAYLIEATDSTFRFYANNGIVLGSDALIASIDNKNPGHFKVPGHGFSAGDRVHIDGIVGMTGLNGSDFLIGTVVNANIVTLKTLAGATVSTIGKGNYITGGKMTKVVAIAGVTSANPAVVTTGTAHGLTTGNEVYLSGIGGMAQLTGFYVVTVTGANTFTLADVFGNVISTIGIGPYTTGGNVSAILEVVTPYLEADLPFLQFSQSQDTMYIDHQNYDPMKLVRVSNANFTINTYTRTADPFPDSGTDHPGVVAFIPGNRLAHANTPTHPVSVWATESPSTTNSAFENFTLGTNDTNAVIITLAPMQGRGDAIRWISVTDQFAFIGTYNGLRSLYGDVPQDGITPTALNSQPVSFYGCAPILPVSTGNTLFYVQRGARIIRAADFNFESSGYQVKDVTETADHLTVSFLKQIVFQQNLPDVLWALVGNGTTAGLTFGAGDASVAGWHRHYVGGSYVDNNGNTIATGKILNVGVMPRDASPEQLWMIVERVINSQTVRSVEYMADRVEFPLRHNFFTGTANQASDDTKWRNAMFEAQKGSNHLDMAVLYDGSQQGQISMTPGAVSGTAVTFTASDNFFTASMEGQEIWKPFDSNGNGGGKAQIVSITNTTQAVCLITVPFNNTNQLAPGSWYLTAQILMGLSLFNGETLQVVADGGPVAGGAAVVNGAINIGVQASKVWAGYKYTGTLRSLNLEVGGVTGPAQTKMRRISRVVGRFMDAVGGQFGTSPYRLSQIVFRDKTDVDDRPPTPRSLEKLIDYQDEFTRFEMEKKFTVYHDQPVPLVVLALDLYFDTNEVAQGQR